ncbi:MAG: phosphoribosylamine--glycine ligase [Crocinitomicaceae bacterium]|nr:phosphoribosylamine--glycine ligase [Crocinitomicaceae bacterium]
MRVLLLGSGGREHALAWKIAQSSILEALFIAPGNAGTKMHGKNVNISPNNFEDVKQFVLENDINMVVVGPEDPLVNGIVDFFEADEELANVPVIGPNKEAAQLEGSKDFSKKFMGRHNIPTAKYGTFTKETLKEGYAFLESMNAPYVLKADGLAAGKGVLILDNLKEAKKELKSMLADAKFGDASSRVVIEQFLNGIELSCFVITDGDAYKKLPEAKDYKRIGEGDQGLNTGGMGAVSPVPFANPTFLDKIENQIIIPTVKGLRAEGIKYKGFIFFGIINVKNEPYVIEYNCRLGDPETEVVIPRLKSDILDLFEGVATNTLSERDVQFDERSATTVMMVSGGYPEAYEKGKQIFGLNTVTDSLVFHAGTASDGPVITTAGGRVLAATSFGKNIEVALKRSYESIEKIEFDKAFYRKDIGHDVL